MSKQLSWSVAGAMALTLLSGCPEEEPSPPQGSDTPTVTNPDGTPTPTPGATDTPTQSGSETETPTSTGNDATPTATPTPTLGGTPTGADTPTPTGNGTPTPTGNGTPTPTGGDTPTPTGGDTPTPTADTPTDTTGTPTPEPTGTPKPTPLPNTSPTINFTAPEDGSTLPQGQEVVLEGLASDAESLPQDLSITFTSDLDGGLGTTAPEEDGTFAYSIFDLSPGTHRIDGIIEDPAAATANDSITLTIEVQDGAPTIDILSPTVLRVQLGDNVDFDILVGDSEDSPDAIAVTVTSDIDGSLFEGNPSAEGQVALSTSGLSRGNQIIRVTATDTDGNTTEAGLELTVNGPPSAPLITLLPQAPDTTTGLIADSLAVDEEGDDLTYTYAWTKNGEAVDVDGPEISAEAAARGETWMVTVVASDPDVSGAEGSASVVIGNAAPTSSGTTLTPAAASALSTLTCEGQGFEDADGDDAGWSYSWLVNGEEVLGAADMTLTGVFARGDEVTCLAAPFDGADAGAPLPSDALIIDNASPTLGDVSLTPFEGATEESILTCETGTPRDGDGDDITTEVVWLNGSATIPGQSGLTLDGASFNKGDTISCRVSVSDEFGPGDVETSNAVFIINTAPLATAAVISPESPGAEDTLSCSAEGSDVDPEDSITFTYAWTLDDVAIDGASTSELAASVASPGEAIRCVVTPSDGDTTGAPLTSAPVTLDNGAPSIEGVDLSPEGPQESSTLTCTPEGYSDPEGDDPIYTYEWSINGEVIDEAGNTLTGDDFNKGDEVTCTVTPSDGFADGDAITSDSLEILNTPPVVESVAISPESPSVESTLMCQVLAQDGDDDDINLAYTWAVNGEGIDGETSGPLEPGAFGAEDTVTCTVTPSDDEESGEPLTSEAVEVGNLAPSAPEISILPPNPLPGESLSVSIDVASEDPDGQDVSYLYTWTANGEATTFDTADIPAFMTAEGDTWAVSVVGTDGSAQSGAATAEVVVTEPDADDDGVGALLDCDDGNSDIYPGAPEAINGIDDDCDGAVDNRWELRFPYGHDDNGEFSAIDVYTPGIVQMVYLDSYHSRVQYARVEDDAVLYVETVDTLVEAADAEARPLDIAVDDLEIPHVVLVDTESGDVVYATRIDGQWSSMTIASDAGVQAKPAIAVDGFGLAHILYRAEGGELVYVRGVFGLMETLPVASSLLGDAFHDIDVDAEGVAHMAWRLSLAGDVNYARFDGSELLTESVVTAINAGQELRLAVDPVSGDVHMAYVNDNTGIVTHIVGNSGDWSDISAASVGSINGVLGLAVNPGTGGPHIMIHDNNETLYHLYREGRGWQTDVAGNFEGQIGINPATAMDINQRVVVSAYDAEGAHLLYGSAPEASDWSFTFYSIDSFDTVGATNDVAVTPDGRAVLYGTTESIDSAVRGSLVLSNVPGKGFLARSPNAQATTHIFGQIEIGEDSTRHVLEWDGASTELNLLTSETGASWSSQTLASNLFSSGGISLETTPAGGVFAAYTDYYGQTPIICGFSTPYYTTLTLTHRASSSDSFETDIIGFACSSTTSLPISHTSVAVSGDDVHIALYRESNGDLLYLVGDTDGNFSASALAIDVDGDTGYNPSIAVNPATGLPGIVSMNRDTGSLRYSTRGIAGVWLTVGLEAAQTSGPAVLRYDSDGNAHILFREAGGERMIYTTNRSGIFVTEPVMTGSSAAAFGDSGGMELDGMGNPHITFYDSASSDIVYARGKMQPAAQPQTR